jgi:hypothetical protein
MTDSYRTRLTRAAETGETRELHNFTKRDPFRSVKVERCWMKENGIEFIPWENDDHEVQSP